MNEFKYIAITILACTRKPFLGMHLVQLQDSRFPNPIWVHSLTRLKKYFFGFKDKLSFERSLYIRIGTDEILCKDIRPIINIPLVQAPVGQMYFYSPHIIRKLEPCKSGNLRDYVTRKDICKRSHTLLRKNLEKAIACYKRDLPFTTLWNIIDRLKTDIGVYVLEFEQTLNATFEDNIIDFAEQLVNLSSSPSDLHLDLASSCLQVEQQAETSSPH